ncbi:response regulator transcription factor [Streptomyces sp. NPDC003077]|uniref:response regulator transcription factor n=1 Tax=Streptomyces sp. NPDC003077 TaxID=3154443 RepID=UPI0033A28DB7
MTRLLLIEDDDALARALRALLTRAGHDVVRAADGREGMRLLFAERPDLMIVDTSLPALSGWEVLERTRDLTDLPVLLLPPPGKVRDRVRGLRAGADDCLSKPFADDELLARVEALLRRAGTAHWSGEPAGEGLRLVPDRRSVVWQGAEVRLSPLEYRLLQVLVRNRERVVTTEQLLTRVWDDPQGVGRDRVKFAVLRVRRKLRRAAGPQPPPPVESVRGMGYRYRPPEGTDSGNGRGEGPGPTP